MNPQRHATWLLASCGGLFVFLALPWPHAASGDAATAASAGSGGVAGAPAPLTVAAASQAPAAALAAFPAAVPPSAASLAAPAALRLSEVSLDAEAGRYVAPLGDGRAVLTMVPELQGRIQKLLADYRVPWAAAVLVEPATGRVLAMAEHSQREPGARALSLKARAPAASVFKIVTSAALLSRGFEPDAEVCYHGGRHRVQRGNLADDPRRDRRCLSLSAALGHSANVVFAKLADRALNAELLRAEARRFLFDTAIPFAEPVEVSRADIPDDPFALATTAAGFGDVRLSPLHGALLAAIVANGGVFVAPEVVEVVEGGAAPVRPAPRRVVDARIAESLGTMMRTTVTEGTARQFFSDRRARSPLKGLSVAGKTGSLSQATPFRDWSWFVGFAGGERSRVAFAVLVENDRQWRVKAPYVAREALRAWAEWDAVRLQAWRPGARGVAPAWALAAGGPGPSGGSWRAVR
jgi:membrane peptidoglycan carboxypeptidase